MPMTSRVHVSGSGLGPAGRAVAQLARKTLAIGIPDTAAERAPEPGEKGTPPSNALVGYWMEFGIPEKNLPARPFLVPGVENARAEIVAGMERAVTAALSGRPDGIDRALDQAGLLAVASVKSKMQAGPFAPLSDRTIEARARRRDADGKLVNTVATRNARKFRKLQTEGTPDAVLHDAGLATPLLDTRSLFTSITHVVREK